MRSGESRQYPRPSRAALSFGKRHFEKRSLRGGSHVQAAAESLGAPAHAAQAVSFALAARIEPFAVLLDPENPPGALAPQLDLDVPRGGVAAHVVQRFLEDQVELPAQIRIDWLVGPLGQAQLQIAAAVGEQ